MDRAVPESEVSARLTELLAELAATGDPVVIERAGMPVGVLVTVSDVEELERLRRFRQRVEALERLREDAIAHPESPFGFQTEAEAEEFGRQMGKEVNRAMPRRLERERRRESA